MAMAEELQEQLLAQEEEPTQWEETLATQEEKARITEKALVKVSADLDAEWVKTEATRDEYLDKMCMHTDRAKHTIGLDKMLGEKKVPLYEKERGLALWESALAEAQAQGLNTQDNREEMTELVGLRK
jgi:hypothetical protein